MSARFRIRTPQGQELSFASVDVFREFVRSGDLSPDDVVYDAETREWSPARTHPVVLEIELEAEEGGEARPAPAERASASEPPDEPPPTVTIGDIGLDLAPAPDQLTPEQEAAAFIGKMEAERAADLTFEDAIQSFTMEPSLPPPVVEPPPAPKPPPPPRPAPTPRYELEPIEREEPRRREAPARAEAPPRKRASSPSSARKYAPFVILLVAVAGGVVYFGPELFAPTASEGSNTPQDPEVEAPAPAIPATDEALRTRAQERFLTSTQAALRQLQPIPQAWLGGRYLSGPSDYTYIRDIWQTYLATIRDVRAADNDRYRAAYERALDDAGVDGAARATRLSSGMNEFQRDAPAREAHYDRVERLATVAMRGHDELVGAEGTILYEPASSPAISADPIIEAVGRTPADQELLEEVLDAILAELQGEGGAATGRNVREWVYGGLLDAVAN